MSSLEEACKKCIESCKKCYTFCKKKEMHKAKDMCYQCMCVCKLVYDLLSLDSCTIEKSTDKICISACKFCIKECGKHKNIPVCSECVEDCKKCIESIMSEYSSNDNNDIDE